jgi:hypothetical protein
VVDITYQEVKEITKILRIKYGYKIRKIQSEFQYRLDGKNISYLDLAKLLRTELNKNKRVVVKWK